MVIKLLVAVKVVVMKKSVDIFGTGDVVIQSNGKGGVYITAAKDNIE